MVSKRANELTLAFTSLPMTHGSSIWRHFCAATTSTTSHKGVMRRPLWWVTPLLRNITPIWCRWIIFVMLIVVIIKRNTMMINCLRMMVVIIWRDRVLINDITGGAAAEWVWPICSGDTPHHCHTPRISFSRSRWKQLSWYSTPVPQLSPLYPSPSPLANGVFVPPACGKDDKTIGENDYGWGGDYFHKTIIFSHTHPTYPNSC